MLRLLSEDPGLLIRDWLNRGRELLGSRMPSAEAQKEAELLMAHALHWTREKLITHSDMPIQKPVKDRYLQFIRRRMEGEPIAYIRGFKEFFSLTFFVSPEVLIPRPETELLVEAALERIAECGAGLHVLDLGTGSGAIAVSIQAAFKIEEEKVRFGLTEKMKPLVIASDINQSSLNIAQMNAARYEVDKDIVFLTSDLFDTIRNKHFDNFDIICTNPPYVPTGYIDSRESSLGYEPRQALDGGPDGLRCIIRILNEAQEYLKPGGVLLMEIGHDQSERIEYYLANMEVYTGVRFIKDLQGIPRILRAEIRYQDTKK